MDQETQIDAKQDVHEWALYSGQSSSSSAGPGSTYLGEHSRVLQGGTHALLVNI